MDNFGDVVTSSGRAFHAAASHPAAAAASFLLSYYHKTGFRVQKLLEDID